MYCVISHSLFFPRFLVKKTDLREGEVRAIGGSSSSSGPPNHIPGQNLGMQEDLMPFARNVTGSKSLADAQPSSSDHSDPEELRDITRSTTGMNRIVGVQQG